MAATTKAYNPSDPVQGGNRLHQSAFASGEIHDEGDHDSLFSENPDDNDDLDSLFGESRCESFDGVLKSKDADFAIPDVDLPQDFDYGDLDTILGLNPTALPLSMPGEIDTGSTAGSKMPFHLRTNLTLPSMPPRPPNGLTLPLAPPAPPSFEIIPPCLTLPLPASVASVHGTHVHQVSYDQQVQNGSVQPSPNSASTGHEIQNSGSSPLHYFSSSLSLPLPTPTGSNREHVDVILPQYDQVPSRTGVASPESLALSAESYSVSNARSTPEFSSVPSTVGLITQGNCSPIRSLFLQTDFEEPPMKKARKAPKTSKSKSFSQPSQDTLRHSLQLGVNTYHFMIEEAKTFMLDENHPKRCEDAVFVKSTLKFEDQKHHDAKLTAYAATLLDSGFGEKWWGLDSEGYADRSLRWPERRVDLMFALPKILTRVCRDHKTIQKREQTKDLARRSVEEAERRVEEAKQRVMRQRERLDTANDVECHISFVLVDDLNYAVRRKIILPAANYSKYMDLVNFLVKLIGDSYNIIGFGIMGPLGYVKANRQEEWEAIIEIIRLTPRMSSIAICTAEVEPKRNRRKSNSRSQSQAIEGGNIQCDVIVLD